MTTVGSFNWGDGDRMLVVKIEGIRHPGVTSTSQITLKVPYRSFARTMQFVRSKGGRIVQVTVQSAAPFPLTDVSRLTQANPQPAPLPELISQLESTPAPELLPHPEIDHPTQLVQPIPEAAVPVQTATEAPKAEALPPAQPEPEIIAPIIQSWLKFITSLIHRLKSRPDLS